MATMIKFRAWDKENEIYLYNVQCAYDTLGGFVKYDDGEDACYDEDCFGGFLNNKRYDVEQFTGLKDVNCDDIYENDIIVSRPTEPILGSPKIGVVKLSKVSFSWCCETENIEDNIWKTDRYRTYEVIGNVHANPELLVENK
ncbi:YopX family protein [Lactiplantibacillus plantarum]|uniref:YopX family protein n=1 Tax=Lactiplantibacillus plantarum TaxID=1590 RepID=UPI00402B2069